MLARRDGLAGISLRDLADSVDFRQPSLYAYFESKLDLYDSMFADGQHQLLARCLATMLFDSVSEEVATVVPVEKLRWITFAHVEADECGAMNQFLAAAPRAQVAHGGLGCMVSLNDLADRPPVPLGDGQVLELGRHRVRHIDTPHVPHGWEARVLFEETTKTLLCGDLFAQLGQGPALTSNDVLAAASEAEDVFGASCITPASAPTIRSLAELDPDIADDFERRLHSTTEA